MFRTLAATATATLSATATAASRSATAIYGRAAVSSPSTASRVLLSSVRSKTSYANKPQTVPQKSPLLAQLEELEVVSKDLLPYGIKRRPVSGWLPVYTAYRNGNTRTLTIVRHIQGDVQRLKSDLSKLIPEERITIGLGGTKLKIVGDYVKVIKDWFVARNF